MIKQLSNHNYLIVIKIFLIKYIITISITSYFQTNTHFILAFYFNTITRFVMLVFACGMAFGVALAVGFLLFMQVCIMLIINMEDFRKDAFLFLDITRTNNKNIVIGNTYRSPSKMDNPIILNSMLTTLRIKLLDKH